MKYHKIKNIPLTICTAEQKIAYNLACSNYRNYIDTYNKMPMQFQKDAIIHRAINDMIKLYGNNNKYNIDAIASCLRAGFENYINGKYHILSSYEDIGRMFPAYYLNVNN